jgi:hypothetical protein
MVQIIRWGSLNFAGVVQKKNHSSFALQDVEIAALRSGKYFLIFTRILLAIAIFNNHDDLL